MAASQAGWVADVLRERLGNPIADTQKMLAFALGDGREIAFQKDVEAVRIWLEHEAERGWPPATVIRAYEPEEGRHSNLPSRLSHRAANRGGRKVIVLSVAGPRMLDAVLGWYGVTPNGRLPDQSVPRPADAQRPIWLRSVPTQADRADAAILAADVRDTITSDVDIARQDPTLEWLVENENASARLCNCVRRSKLARMTIREALAGPRALLEVCMGVPAMGKKSIRELQYLLSQSPNSTDDPSDHAETLSVTIARRSEREDIRKELQRLSAKMNVGIVCRSRGASVRLLNGIAGSRFEALSLGDVVLEWRSCASELKGLRNFGNTSVGELNRICRTILADLLAAAKISPSEIDDIVLIGFDEDASAVSDYADILNYLKALPPFEFADLKSKAVMDISSIVETLLEPLDARARDVVTRRNGLGGTGDETLEQIAQEYSVTRERIRQIESKAMGRIRDAAEYLPIPTALSTRVGELWPELASEKGYVAAIDIDQIVLPPDMMLTMKVADCGLGDLLDACAVRWRAGWHKLDVPNTELDALSDTLKRNLDGAPLPRPLAADLSEETRMVLDLGLGLSNTQGYLLAPDGTRRAQMRVIDLHRIFGTSSRPTDVLALAQRLAHHTDDEVMSSRYLSMIMARQPHLFLEAAGDNWFALGLGDDMAAPGPDEGRRRAVGEPATRDGMTMAGLLRSVLSKSGPLRLSELTDRASVALTDGQSIASIGPTLIMHRETFVRYLPGVYGLKKEAPDNEHLLREAPEYLLNEEQARLFALGRRAGAAWHVFPLWTPAAELALCRWAMEFGSEDIRESLLSVASVSLWPIGHDDRALWMARVASAERRFHLHFDPREQVGYVLPRLDRLLAACLEARATGEFNWITANLVLNRTVGSHVAAGVMALMCSLNALACDGTHHWQLPHRAGAELDKLITTLSRRLHDVGSLTWASEVGQAILSKAAGSLCAPHGWLDRGLLAAMLDSAGGIDSGGEHVTSDFGGRAIQVTIDELLWDEEDFAVPTLPEARNALEADYSAPKISGSRIVTEQEEDWVLGDLAAE